MSSDPEAAGSSVSATTPLIEYLAFTVRATPGVHDIHAGPLGEIATYLPGRRINGLRLTGDDGSESCEVHIVLEDGAAVLETAHAVREAIESLIAGPVHVTVEDIDQSSAPSASNDSTNTSVQK